MALVNCAKWLFVCEFVNIYSIVAKMVIIYTDQTTFILSLWPLLVANVLVLSDAARVALDRAAPNKLAVALFLDVADPGLVAAAAAQQPATLDAVRGAIAEASPGAEDAEAEIKRLYFFPVHKIFKSF